MGTSQSTERRGSRQHPSAPAKTPPLDALPSPSKPIKAVRREPIQHVIDSPAPSFSPYARRTVAPVEMSFVWSLGGEHVSVTGSFLDWSSERPLEKQADGTFSVSQLLSPGVYQYKFIVDGVWRHHPDQPTVHDEVGNINNFCTVVEATGKQMFPRRSETPPGSYGQEMPPEMSLAIDPSAKNKAHRVPNIPPHLLRALLNTAPSPDDPSTLPLPHHVMVNHLYMLPRATHTPHLHVLGATHMYKNKFVTTVYYSEAEDPVLNVVEFDEEC